MSTEIQATPSSRANDALPSTASTPSTKPRLFVEGVEAVERGIPLPEYFWEIKDGLSKNFRSLGRLLATLPLQLYRRADGGLILADGDQARPIATAKELAPLLIDNVNITITKNGNYYGERFSQAVLTDMLGSRAFLGNFKLVKDVATSPIVLADHAPSQPGYNPLGSNFTWDHLFPPPRASHHQ